MGEKLKPCPFCGGVPSVTETDYADRYFARNYVICCADCTAEVSHDTEQEAVVAWNRRVLPPATAEAIEILCARMPGVVIEDADLCERVIAEWT